MVGLKNVNISLLWAAMLRFQRWEPQLHIYYIGISRKPTNVDEVKKIGDDIKTAKEGFPIECLSHLRDRKGESFEKT
jgi:hypothetical protein